MKEINSLPEVSPALVIDRILKDSGQFDLSPVDLGKLDDLLKLVSYNFDFNNFEDKGLVGEQLSLRGILDIQERSIYLDDNESYEPRKRFSHAHEIGHYLLPHHREYFYRCNEQDMKHYTDHLIEKEANEFASGLLFKGSLFGDFLKDIDIISFNTAAEIAELFHVSKIAATRKLVSETNLPAALVVIKESANNPRINYTITSKSMREKYLREVTKIPALSEILDKSKTSTKNDPHRLSLKSKLSTGEPVTFDCQFYFNGYEHLGILTPND